MRGPESGSSLVEGLIAAVVAIIAALAMIFALVSANAGVKSMRIERGAFFVVQQQMEKLIAKPSSDPNLTIGNHGPQSAALPYVAGQTTWNVAWVDDTLDGVSPSDSDPQDYRKLQVTVTWTDVISRSVALTTYLYP